MSSISSMRAALSAAPQPSPALATSSTLPVSRRRARIAGGLPLQLRVHGEAVSSVAAPPTRFVRAAVRDARRCGARRRRPDGAEEVRGHVPPPSAEPWFRPQQPRPQFRQPYGLPGHVGFSQPQIVQ